MLSMHYNFIRVYKDLDLTFVKAHLLIYGDLSGSCAACQRIDIKINENLCPQCKTEFKYIAFRHPQSHLPKIKKLMAERPSLQIIDFDDYNKCLASNKAHEFLK